MKAEKKVALTAAEKVPKMAEYWGVRMVALRDDCWAARKVASRVDLKAEY